MFLNEINQPQPRCPKCQKQNYLLTSLATCKLDNCPGKSENAVNSKDERNNS